MILSKRQQRVALALADADGKSFEDLVVLAGLDPARAFRGADLRGVDFGNVDLAGFDFTDADLSGASLARASTKGAVFSNTLTHDVQWPRPRRRSRVPIELSDLQHHAVQRMLADIVERRRAVALMPLGTGRGVVLETVIDEVLRKQGYGALLVNTIAERDQFADRLERRLGPGIVWRATRGPDLVVKPGLIIQASTYRDLAAAQWPALAETYGQFQAIFTTSIEKVQQLARGGGGEALRDTIIATVDSMPIDADRPDRRRLASRVKRLFGEASFVFEVEEAVSAGLLEEVAIMRSERAADTAAMVRAEFVPKVPPRFFFELAEQLHELLERSDYPSLVVLCRDDNFSAALEHMLVEEGVAQGRPVTRVGARWDNRRLPPEPAAMLGYVLMPVSRQALETARNHPSVAVLAPLTVARAQDLAFRPPRSRQRREPIIYDLVDAFAGFWGRMRL